VSESGDFEECGRSLWLWGPLPHPSRLLCPRGCHGVHPGVTKSLSLSLSHYRWRQSLKSLPLPLSLSRLCFRSSRLQPLLRLKLTSAGKLLQEARLLPTGSTGLRLHKYQPAQCFPAFQLGLPI